MHVFSLSDDLIFLLLYLWVNWWNPELPVCPCTGQASRHHALSSFGRHVSGVSGHQQLHAVHVADLQTGQQRTAAHVSGERTFTTSLTRNGREGTTGAVMSVLSVCAGGSRTLTVNVRLQMLSKYAFLVLLRMIPKSCRTHVLLFYCGFEFLYDFLETKKGLYVNIDG